MFKQKINSNKFSQKMGSYSHGYSIDVGNSKIIFTTGQIAIDKEGDVVAPNDIEKQTEFVYKALSDILEDAGATLDDVVKTTVYLTSMNDFPKFTAIRNKYLKNSEPASTLVEVNKLVKEGCVVEIEVVVVKNK